MNNVGKNDGKMGLFYIKNGIKMDEMMGMVFLVLKMTWG
jgi:hypothetical protein